MNKLEIKCPYCRGLHQCKAPLVRAEDLRCVFPDEIEVNGEVVKTFDDSNPPRLPWHPEAECKLCGRLLDCAACGDKGFIEVPEVPEQADVLGKVLARLDILAKGEEAKAAELLKLVQDFAPHSRIDGDLGALANHARRADLHSRVAGAYRWAAHDIKCAVLGHDYATNEEFKELLAVHPTERK